VVLDVFVGREEVGEESDDQVVSLLLAGIGHNFDLGSSVVVVVVVAVVKVVIHETVGSMNERRARK
jgi:ABC-type antimicrobial peptide transport system permease subunit